MKVTLALLVIPTVAAFRVPTFSRGSVSTTALSASRNAKKIATRTAWASSRGVSGIATESTPLSVATSGLMTNDAGLEFVKLVHPESGASSEIYLYGGVVTSFQDGTGTEFIAVRPDAKMDGSKPISGGLSHCWPQVCDSSVSVSLSFLKDTFSFPRSFLVTHKKCLHSFSLDPVPFNSTALREMSTGPSSP